MQLNPTGFKEDVVRNMISHHPHIPASLTKDSNSCEIKFNRLSWNHLTDPWWTKIEKGKIRLFVISDWGQPLSSTRSTHNWGLPRGRMDLLAKESKSDRFLHWPKPWFLTIQFEQVSSGQIFLNKSTNPKEPMLWILLCRSVFCHHHGQGDRHSTGGNASKMVFCSLDNSW